MKKLIEKFDKIDNLIYSKVEAWAKPLSKESLNMYHWILAVPFAFSFVISMMYGLSLILVMGFFLPILEISNETGALSILGILILYHGVMLSIVWFCTIVARLTDLNFDIDKLLNRFIFIMGSGMLILMTVEQYNISGKLI